MRRQIDIKKQYKIGLLSHDCGLRLKGTRVRKTNVLERSPIHLLHRASQSVAELFAREISSDLTPRQLAVLTGVAKKEGCSQTDIVNLTGIDRSTVAEMVKRMVGKGLLHRRRSKEDARAYIVRLTDEGRRVLKGAAPLAKRIDDRVLGALGGRAAAFLDSLNVLTERLASDHEAGN